MGGPYGAWKYYLYIGRSKGKRQWNKKWKLGLHGLQYVAVSILVGSQGRHNGLKSVL